MTLAHVLRALGAVTKREIIKFAQQRGRLLSGIVRPLFWLVVFAAGFQNVFGVSIIPPYKTYITYQTYIVPGLLGIVLLFNGMLSSLSMVYDREMGIMRLLLTAPLPRWILLACKLAAGTALSVIQAYTFLATAALFGVTFDAMGYVEAAGRRGGDRLPAVGDQPLHPCGGALPLRALWHVRAGGLRGGDRLRDPVLRAGHVWLRSAARDHQEDASGVGRGSCRPSPQPSPAGGRGGG